MAKVGRPKKKYNRRVVTVWIDENILAGIDERVAEIKQTNREYTRADFINDAAQAALEGMSKKKTPV